MNNNIIPYDLLNKSVMSKSEVIKYILDDFRIDLHELKKIFIYKYKQNINKPNASKIPHHRYNLLFENGELIISPYDGALRVKHIIIEIQILEVYLKRTIEFEIIEETQIQNIDNAVKDIVSKLGPSVLNGVIIGSIWNINFLINRKIRGHIYYKELFEKLDENNIEKYIEHRLRVSDIENSLLNGSINNIDNSIFQEGGLPTKKIYDYVKQIHKNMEYITDKNELLHDYLGLDYIFFNDLKNNTNIFNESTKFPETQIFSNEFLTYQIIKIPNKKGKYLNISWIESSVLGYILEKIQNKYNYREFLMYGKCGALEKSLKVGSIVAPKSVFNEKKIHIQNNIKDLPNYDFISVDSPLVETHDWLKNALSLKINCVEMELYDIFNKIKLPEHIEISYYVSDNLSSDFKLSNRFDFLNQRLNLTERIVNKLF